MRYQIRIGCGREGLSRLRAQWLGRAIRELGHGAELVPQADPLVGLSVRYCDAVLLPGWELALLPSQPDLTLAAWLPAPDPRVAWCSPQGQQRLQDPDFPAQVHTCHAALAAQWQLLHPNHQVRVLALEAVPGLPPPDGYLVPAETLYHRGLLADAVAFPPLIPPPAWDAYAVLVRTANHALRDQLAVLDARSPQTDSLRLGLALCELLPRPIRNRLGAVIRHGELQACLALPGGLRQATVPADALALPALAQQLMAADDD